VQGLLIPRRGIEYVEPRGFDLRGDLRELGRLLERSRPDLCILDSFRTLWGGEENSSGEVASALDPLRALLRDRDVAGVLIHHLGRRGGEYRGSSAIGASVENLLELARVEGDPDRRRRRLRNPRCRFEEEAPDRWLTIEADRRLGALFIEEAEPYEAEDAPPAVRAPVRASLAPASGNGSRTRRNGSPISPRRRSRREGRERPSRPRGARRRGRRRAGRGRLAEGVKCHAP